ncbi:MAG: hypothetical protein JSS60_04575 [Verrucomicrobia bacterium]|nr:hypothetical protein [Verrucomicrobiota bacterium]
MPHKAPTMKMTRSFDEAMGESPLLRKRARQVRAVASVALSWSFAALSDTRAH